MNLKHLLSGIATLALVSVLALDAQQNCASVAAHPRKSIAQKNAAYAANEGERLFEQHCSRCHSAPEGFSPRITGAIVRHMRVRASLSKHDEEALLRFFNP